MEIKHLPTSKLVLALNEPYPDGPKFTESTYAITKAVLHENDNVEFRIMVSVVSTSMVLGCGYNLEALIEVPFLLIERKALTKEILFECVLIVYDYLESLVHDALAAKIQPFSRPLIEESKPDLDNYFDIIVNQL